VAYVRTVKTASGATAVQIVWSSRRGSRSIEHLGSAHDAAELAALKAAGAERLAANQAVLDLGVTAPPGSEPLAITSSQMTHLWDGPCAAYRILGFESATQGDNVFRDLVLAQIIEPTSKIDAERVLTEVGVEPASYATLKRRLPIYAQPRWRQSLAAASARRAGLGPASLVLFDVSTLYFETDTGDGFREPGFSKERRLEPQITLGLLTDASGFPLTVEAFEGNRAETATMLPVINAFKTAHHLSEVTVVADAGMISEANQVALQAAGLSFILGTRIPYLPDVVREWCDKHPDEAIPDGLVLTQPWPATGGEKARGIPDRVIYYQFRHDRARRTLRGIDEQIAKAERAVDGHAPVKRNRYIQLSGRDEDGESAVGGQDTCPGGVEGLHDQPHRRRLGLRDRRLPPAVAHRESLPDVQARPGCPPDLSPPTRINRSAPEHRGRCDGRQPLHRAPNRLEHQEIRTNHSPLPHSEDKSRQPDPDRSRPATRRPANSAHQDPRRRCALN